MRSLKVIAVLTLALLGLNAGCANWRLPKPDLNRLRDPRAVDIDGRLSNEPSTPRVRDF